MPDIIGFVNWLFGGVIQFIKEFATLAVMAIIAFPLFFIFIIWEIRKSGERRSLTKRDRVYTPSESNALQDVLNSILGKREKRSK